MATPLSPATPLYVVVAGSWKRGFEDRVEAFSLRTGMLHAGGTAVVVESAQ